jgi:thiol:disulfide interchange protein DsbA
LLQPVAPSVRRKQEYFMRNFLLTAIFAAASLFGAAAQAAEFQAGKEYVELSSPVPVADPSKIEVVELFWYGCPHCYQFEPVIKPWVEQLPEDVQFKRIPAMFGGIWNVHGQLFIALESMGVEPKVHDAVFAAYHQERKKLATPDEMADFLAGHGIDKQAFLKAYNSFGVRGRVEQAKKLGMAYQITGVPVMIVNGKYRFDLGSSGGPERTLQVADFLIEKERAAR